MRASSDHDRELGLPVLVGDVADREHRELVDADVVDVPGQALRAHAARGEALMYRSDASSIHERSLNIP